MCADALPDWSPNAAAARNSAMGRFLQDVVRLNGLTLRSYDDLWSWSVSDVSRFWDQAWDLLGVAGTRGDGPALADPRMPGAAWFPGATLNYAENVFRGRAPHDVALVHVAESGARIEYTWHRLEQAVGAYAASLRRVGIGRGDTVVGYLPNAPEAVISFLAAASIGATWSMCGPDYAASGATGRMGQLRPRVLVASTAYTHKGRLISKVRDIADLVASMPSLEHVIIVAGDAAGLFDAASSSTPVIHQWGDWVAGPAKLEVEPVPFDHPLWVLFTSGTTGKPKGLVHGHGGIVLQHKLQLSLHWDLHAGDRFLWYTTTNWMMWNLLVGSLLVGAAPVLYDGAPNYPDPGRMWRLAADEGASVFGTSPGYLAASQKAALSPGVEHDLTKLRMVGSTGAPLPAAANEWIASHVSAAVQVVSSTGGTDVAASFAGASPLDHVFAGEISAPALGVDLDAWDEHGSPVRGDVGELVVKQPVPSMPVKIWGDDDGRRYQETYFSQFPGVWCHGDWITLTDRGTVVVHGRSDSTLNRNGVRLGSAEIYAALDHEELVSDALVVGVDRPYGGYWLPLFVVLKGSRQLDGELAESLRSLIAAHASPRHVPDEIITVPALPHTRTGKRMEVPVKRYLQGAAMNEVADPQAVDDPDAFRSFFQSLEQFRNPAVV